ncbi:hypothetical protein EYR36_010733 [Pleurotus pulmonarius]|nr:hypothetical protein EYR36_010733 [Pleurotus pulmonarius]
MPIDPILQAVRALIDEKRAQRSPPPTARDIQEQIRLFGQYAILSHRWDGEELSFLDVEDLAEPKVQAKKGFKKLAGFSNIIKTHFGCRYLWIDTMCIDDESRNASIPLMFSWYRHAYPTFDPTISFDSTGVMRIMVSLYPGAGVEYYDEDKTEEPNSIEDNLDGNSAEEWYGLSWHDDEDEADGLQDTENHSESSDGESNDEENSEANSESDDSDDTEGGHDSDDNAFGLTVLNLFFAVPDDIGTIEPSTLPKIELPSLTSLSIRDFTGRCARLLSILRCKSNNLDVAGVDDCDLDPYGFKYCRYALLQLCRNITAVEFAQDQLSAVVLKRTRYGLMMEGVCWREGISTYSDCHEDDTLEENMMWVDFEDIDGMDLRLVEWCLRDLRGHKGLESIKAEAIAISGYEEKWWLVAPVDDLSRGNIPDGELCISDANTEGDGSQDEDEA